jgi:hypothetical protein
MQRVLDEISSEEIPNGEELVLHEGGRVVSVHTHVAPHDRWKELQNKRIRDGEYATYTQTTI